MKYLDLHLKENLIRKGIPNGKLVVLSDCVDNEIFQQSRSKEHGNGILYAGHLYSYKGISTFLGSAKLINNHTFYILGGSLAQIIKWKLFSLIVTRNFTNNVKFLGWIKHKRIPLFLSKAAILVLPPEKWHPSAAWTSPVKLGEYLSSGRPVVCSKIPALEHWVDEKSVTWFEPGDYRNLSQILRIVLRNTDNPKFESQIQTAQKFDYKNKAKALLDCLNR